MNNSKGFTLVEILIVIGMIGVLTTLLFVFINPFKQIQKAKDAQRQQDLKQIGSALDTYYNDHNCYPTSLSFGLSFSQGSTIYMKKTPQDPDCSGGGSCYQYIVDPASTCPQWNVLFSKALSNSSSISCALQNFPSNTCLPSNYSSAGYNSCLISGNVDCAVLRGLSIPLSGGGVQPTPTSPPPTSAPTPTAAPTPTSAPVPTPTSIPAPTPTPTPIIVQCLQDRTLTYVSTPVMARPNYLVQTADSTWATKITRISNTSGVRHAYSRTSAWNSSGTKILHSFAYPGRMLNGSTYADLGSFSQISQATWANTDPNKIYGTGGNILYSQNATTGVLSVLHTFTGYATTNQSNGYDGISIGDGEGGIDDTDTYIALMAQTSGMTSQHLIVYNIKTNTVVSDISLGTNRPNNAQISRKGNYVVVVDSDTRRYTRDLSSYIVLTPSGNHGDNALDASGNEIYVANNAPGVKSFLLSNGAATQLLPGTTAYEYGHVSGRNINRPGWVYLSVYDNSATANRPGHDQVVAVKTDGSGTVEVFGFTHHTNTSTYSMQPHAVPSPDGTRVIFTSEWGASEIYDYVAGC